MTSEVFFSVLPREPREPASVTRRRCFVRVELVSERGLGSALMELPSEVLDDIEDAGRRAGHGLLGEIKKRLFLPRPVVWRGRTVR